MRLTREMRRLRICRSVEEVLVDMPVEVLVHGDNQSMEWTGSIRWIHNPVQSRRMWIGLDKKFTN